MFRTTVRNGSEQSYRYVRSANGTESWTPRSTSGPKSEMVARNDWPCKFAGCGDRTVIANVTVIAKVGGKWGHKVCPVAAPKEIVVDTAYSNMDDDDRAMADAEMAADRAGTIRDSAKKFQSADDEQDAIDAALAEFAAQNRKRNLENTKKAIYRVSLNGQEGRYVKDHVNIALVPNEKYGSVKISDYNGDSIGVIKKDGTIRLWDDTDANSAHTKAVLAGLDILLGSADPTKFAEAFAVEAEACMRCGRALVDDKSRARLLGPECASKW